MSEEEGEGSGILSRRGAKAYQWAMEAAFSIPIAIGLGYWADSYFGTSPVWLFVGVVVGLGACIRGLLRIRKLVPDAAPEDGLADEIEPENGPEDE